MWPDTMVALLDSHIMLRVRRLYVLKTDQRRLSERPNCGEQPRPNGLTANGSKQGMNGEISGRQALDRHRWPQDESVSLEDALPIFS